MTTPLRCSTPNCTRTPKAEWAVCPDCADRLIASALRQPVVHEPEWVRRMRRNAGVPKDYTAA
jgi:hypothetical protein